MPWPIYLFILAAALGGPTSMIFGVCNRLRTAKITLFIAGGLWVLGWIAFFTCGNLPF